MNTPQVSFDRSSAGGFAGAANLGLAGLVASTPKASMALQPKRYRMLIVDDARANLDLLAHSLSHLYLLSFATSGEAALKLAANVPFDLVLLDIVMPTIDGYETCRRLRQIHHMQNVPIIFMSALGELKSKTDGFEAGGVDYLTKPLEMAEVLARVDVHLKLKSLVDTQKELLAELSDERDRTDLLLHNILPPSIAEQLKNGEAVPARLHENTSVVFADLAGFTGVAHQHTPEEVINFLNEVFSQFDLLSIRYGLYKIKTIGDCYMAVAGLSEASVDHAQRAARFALELFPVIEQARKQMGFELGLRVGIHSGPVIAGVIGINKFAYDLWGDTVNIASRMESQGEPGRVHLTETAHSLIETEFECEARGEIELRGRGKMKTWWLNGSKAVGKG